MVTSEADIRIHVPKTIGEHKPPFTVAQILQYGGVGFSKKRVVMVNGQLASEDTEVKAGNIVEVIRSGSSLSKLTVKHLSKKIGQRKPS